MRQSLYFICYHYISKGICIISVFNGGISRNFIALSVLFILVLISIVYRQRYIRKIIIRYATVYLDRQIYIAHIIRNRIIYFVNIESALCGVEPGRNAFALLGSYFFTYDGNFRIFYLFVLGLVIGYLSF